MPPYLEILLPPVLDWWDHNNIQSLWDVLKWCFVILGVGVIPGGLVALACHHDTESGGPFRKKPVRPAANDD